MILSFLTGTFLLGKDDFWTTVDDVIATVFLYVSVDLSYKRVLQNFYMSS